MNTIDHNSSIGEIGEVIALRTSASPEIYKKIAEYMAVDFTGNSLEMLTDEIRIMLGSIDVQSFYDWVHLVALARFKVRPCNVDFETDTDFMEYYPHVVLIDDASKGLASRLDGIPAKEIAKILTKLQAGIMPGYRAPFVHDLVEKFLLAQPVNGSQMYTIGHNLYRDLWRKYHVRAQYNYIDVDDLLDSPNMPGELIEDIPEMSERESAIWASMPDWVSQLVKAKLEGETVKGWRALKLKVWASENKAVMAL